MILKLMRDCQDGCGAICGELKFHTYLLVDNYLLALDIVLRIVLLRIVDFEFLGTWVEGVSQLWWPGSVTICSLFQLGICRCCDDESCVLT